MALQWLAVNLLTGAITCDLPTLEARDPFRRTLGRYETNTAVLTITDTIDPSWERGILEGASACIAYTGDPGQEVIVWGGIITQAPRTISSDKNGNNTVELALVTPEAYLDRRYTGAYQQTGRDQNLIVTDLIQQFAADTGGLPITTQVIGAPGTTRDRTYNDYDDKTVYSNLTDLMAVKGGPEWTVHWQWNRGGSQPTITPLLQVGTRLGAPVNPGMQPNVTFDTSTLITATVGRDWSNGAGANIITATSSGQGLARPQATSQATDFQGRPKYEYRYSPSTSILDTVTLQGHADQARDVLQNGAQPITLVAAIDQPGLRLGIDWNLGDDIGYDLASPTMPNGVKGIARCIGYEATNTTITPILWTPQVIQ